MYGWNYAFLTKVSGDLSTLRELNGLHSSKLLIWGGGGGGGVWR